MTIIGETIGAIQAATNVSGLLLGCLAVQAYGYLKHYTRDPLGIRCLALVLLMLGVAQQLAMVTADYNMVIDRFGDVSILAHLPASFGVAFFLDLFNSPLVESFYFWRIYKLTNKIWPSALGATLSWLRCSGWIAFAAQGARKGYTNPTLLDNNTWLLVATLAYGLVANTCVAGIMIYYLYQNRDTPFMRTKVLIDRLILWTIQTCFVTGLGYAATLVAFLSMKHNFIWLGILACTTRVCANCLLAELNDRPKHRRPDRHRLNNSSDGDIPLEQTNNGPIVISISTERTMFGHSGSGTSGTPDTEVSTSPISAEPDDDCATGEN